MRSCINLNEHWKFFRGDEPKAWYRGLDDSQWQNVTLPHDWSVAEPFSKAHSSGTGYLPGGLGIYRKTFRLEPDQAGKRVRITFDGVYNHAQVWVNSYYLGNRPYGYSAFSYDITEFISFGEQENVVTVRVDHKDIADSRWFTGSGIYRDVTLTLTDPVHVDHWGLAVTTPEVSAERAVVAVETRVVCPPERRGSVALRHTLTLGDGTVCGVTQDVPVPGEAPVAVRLEILRPQLWSPESPTLYTLLTEVLCCGVVTDRVETPVGIRSVAFDAREGFFLNGTSMKLKGVCVHHDAGCLGAAVPRKVWERRLKTLKAMGCNAIRMSHNPPAANLLDLCDTMGFLVMDEAFDEWEGVKNKWSTGHNVYPPKHYGYYEDFPEWGERDIKAMVLRDRNHPSVILWSIGNEVDYPNDPYCHPTFQSMTGNNDANKPAAEREYDPHKPNAERLAVIARKLTQWVKEVDTSRPVTAALAFPELSNQTGYAAALDIVGYNYKEHLYAEDCARYPDRVIYGSENGASLEAWQAVENNRNICGQFIWTGIDYLGECRGWPVRVAQAGFLDLAGFCKPGYYYRQSLWATQPVLFLTARKKVPGENPEHSRWDLGQPVWQGQHGDLMEVRCFTNMPEGTLFLNGKSLGTRQLENSSNRYLYWETPFEAGTLEVVAGTHCCALYTPDAVRVLKASLYEAALTAGTPDVAQVIFTVEDGAGHFDGEASLRVNLTVTGPGELMGLENGDPQDLEAYSASGRKTFRGRLIAYVRSTGQPGVIVVTAEGGPSGTLTLNLPVET